MDYDSLLEAIAATETGGLSPSRRDSYIHPKSGAVGRHQVKPSALFSIKQLLNPETNRLAAMVEMNSLAEQLPQSLPESTRLLESLPGYHMGPQYLRRRWGLSKDSQGNTLPPRDLSPQQAKEMADYQRRVVEALQGRNPRDRNNIRAYADGGKVSPLRQVFTEELPKWIREEITDPLVSTLAPTTNTALEAVTRQLPLSSEAWAIDDARKDFESGRPLGGLMTLALGLVPGGLSLRHNLRPNSLEFLAKNQALPHPSIAVLPTRANFTDFGPYTMVMDPKKVRPSRQNPLYSRDVWTARNAAKGKLADDAEDLLIDEESITHLLGIQQAPEFHSLEAYKKSPHGAKLLTLDSPDYSKLDDKFWEMGLKSGKVDENYSFLGYSPEMLEFIRSLPSRYGELKYTDTLPLDSVKFIAGPKSAEVRDLVEGGLKLPFEPTKSQLRTEVPDLIEEYRAVWPFKTNHKP